MLGPRQTQWAETHREGRVITLVRIGVASRSLRTRKLHSKRRVLNWRRQAFQSEVDSPAVDIGHSVIASMRTSVARPVNVVVHQRES